MPKTLTSLKLLADIGGTNARFRSVSASGEERTVVFKVAKFSGSIELFQAAILTLECEDLTEVYIAAAGPVECGSIRLTNSNLIIEAKALSEAINSSPAVRLINDVEAAVFGIQSLLPQDSVDIGEFCQKKKNNAPFGLISVGTGLGVSCCFPMEGQYVALPTEGGHSTLPSFSSFERSIIERLGQKFGHASCELILSGPGLAVLYEVMNADVVLTPGQIVDGALDGDYDCVRVINQFCSFLGGVAGNIALMYGAWAGVFIGGGVPVRFLELLQGSQFRERFENKGKLKKVLMGVPTRLIKRDDVALLGLARLARVSEV